MQKQLKHRVIVGKSQVTFIIHAYACLITLNYRIPDTVFYKKKLKGKRTGGRVHP